MPEPSPLPMSDAVVLAPLSGYTDLPFRTACRRHGCLYAFTPLLDAASLVHENPRNKQILPRGEHEPWLGVQLLGDSPEILRAACELLPRDTYDIVDLNLGCPVRKVTRRGAGAALGADRERACRCVEALVEVCECPVTAKIRVQAMDTPETTVELARGLEAAGIAALVVHGRVMERFYSGPVACSVIREARRALRIPVLANGGAFCRESASVLRTASGCAGIMVARGAIGNPWLFSELGDPAFTPPGHEELCAEVELHVEGMVRLYGEDVAMRNARKIILAYLTGRGYRRCRRRAVTSISTWAEFEDLMVTLRQEGPSAHYDAAKSPKRDVLEVC
ncbi:MAG: tRNA-dihydrouridine synthase family protein [Lentisphaerae bacterium]|jgi:tRNA-dihydrouridine synthase B|nr:tRNA-dihydrouridine synthase family protein [Lentisphaerota bacterium]MBT4819160.1 tRNA-dihydrouridine synthase family protein [Lentisphaerota bacterium]MBT5607345.1 tRNA-dihydrouridine synthase family protein [Lentisphaerota bacterium]MBT7058355.1 tRNA-dihydrouridine synthase family protein [Lentisphaerota bacterium]MBT7841672.1 tRNA-dihydrouridine synthase family protein [Lentisphaerota bacterium]